MTFDPKQYEPATAEDLLRYGMIVRDFSGFRFLAYNPNTDDVVKIHGVGVNPQKYAYIAWGGDPPKLRLICEFDSEAEFDAWTVAVTSEEDHKRVRTVLDDVADANDKRTAERLKTSFVRYTGNEPLTAKRGIIEIDTDPRIENSGKPLRIRGMIEDGKLILPGDSNDG